MKAVVSRTVSAALFISLGVFLGLAAAKYKLSPELEACKAELNSLAVIAASNLDTVNEYRKECEIGRFPLSPARKSLFFEDERHVRGLFTLQMSENTYILLTE